MIAKLKYNLPEEQETFNDALNGWKWKAIHKLVIEELKRISKNDLPMYTAEEMKSYLLELINDKNLNLYD